ncbi:MAG: twin-arginine translocase TatA/TatE family subunit [Oscillatoriales cyanobacterium RU_3_3]|nr:twin-arginine translocase TatA/TatE family subunit [Oscillatoriales cyanobacterium RU_3_3]
MNIFGIGLPEMAVIFTIALCIRRKNCRNRPEFGKAIRGFQDASRDFESEFKREAQQLEEAVASKPAPEKLAAATPKEDSTES